MTLQEALKKGNGKARRKKWAMGAYTFIRGDVFVTQLATLDGAQGGQEKGLSDAEWLATDCLPYSSEPVMCEACVEAGEITSISKIDAPHVLMAHHLRKFHCQCQKEGE